MSLAIDIDHVVAVLLNGVWHEVHDLSFTLDAYEFVWQRTDLVHGGGESGVCATGFSFQEAWNDGMTSVSGPLTSIQAVRHKRA